MWFIVELTEELKPVRWLMLPFYGKPPALTTERKRAYYFSSEQSARAALDSLSPALSAEVKVEIRRVYK